MFFSADIWKMLAGVAIFLLGMGFMEDAMRLLAGRKFKLFLKRQTSSKIKAIGSGAIVTSLLQSSSVVNLLVLSLVGAGVIKMQNALAVMMGANLGTTFSNWIVATVGFSFSTDILALPIAAVTGICIGIFTTRGLWYQWCRFLLGFSFLFIGLGFIKEGMMSMVEDTDLGFFNQYPIIVFFLIGVVLTTIIQSSSATMALTLSALYTGAIPLYSATAIVLGAEIGTTFKLFLASAKGLPVKKRVALGNFLFNSITVVILFFLLRPMNWLITEVFQVRDNLLALVLFQSLVNVAGIILFYPFLNKLGRFLEQRYTRGEEGTVYISKVPATDPELAVEALENETRHFIFHILDFTSKAFGSEYGIPAKMLHRNDPGKTIMEKYDYIKRLHGEMHGFYIRLQNMAVPIREAERLEQLISSTRNGMYAAKNIRDALKDIDQLRNSSNDTKYNFYLQTRQKMAEFSKELIGLLEQRQERGSFEKITRIFQTVQHGYSESLQELYREGIAGNVDESEISTLVNFNREMYTAFKSMFFAMKDFLLNPEEGKYFEELPGFIR